MKILVENLSPKAVAKIERRMRRGRASEEGFLGPKERLFDVIARDRRVLSELSVTPQQIADRLESIVRQAYELVAGDLIRSMCPRDIEVEGRFLVTARSYMGIQECPFEDSKRNRCEDDELGCSDFVVRNIESGQELSFPGLAIHLIRDHHFFEGAVSYRVDPARAAAILELHES